jgi:hypothetical protein
MEKLTTSFWKHRANEIKKKTMISVEWLALLLCTCEIPSSNLDPETGYPDLEM